jgi:hypothetical protein
LTVVADKVIGGHTTILPESGIHVETKASHPA